MLKIKNLLFVLIAFSYGLYILTTIVRENLPVSIFGDNAVGNTFSEIHPQGWGFFTKDPCLPYRELFFEDNEGNIIPHRNSPTAMENLFGWKRDYRVNEYDISSLTILNSEDNWFECELNYHECALEAKSNATLFDPNRIHSDLSEICRFYIFETELVPLSYYDLGYIPNKKVSVYENEGY